MTIDDIIANVLKAEGGYTNNKDDKGGETNFGVTVTVARAAGYQGPMASMPRAVAIAIYRKRYVDAPGFSALLPLSPSIAAEVVDTGVNMGPDVAGRMLQRALNGLEDVGLVVDGNIARKSLDALTLFLRHRGSVGEDRLLALLNALQGVRYLELAEGRAANRGFLFGWLARIL